MWVESYLWRAILYTEKPKWIIGGKPALAARNVTTVTTVLVFSEHHTLVYIKSQINNNIFLI